MKKNNNFNFSSEFAKKFKELDKLIKAHKRIYILRHTHPDGDALGSQFALKGFIQLNYRNKEVITVGAEKNRFLNDYFPKDNFDEIYLGETSKHKKALVIILDCANYERISGKSKIDTDKSNLTLVKIDHHNFEEPEDKNYSLLIVGKDAASTTQILSMIFFSNKKFEVSAIIASHLYLGLLTDSKRFYFQSTSPQTFEAARLIRQVLSNKDIKNIYDSLYVKSRKLIMFENKVLEAMDITPNGFASFELTKKLCEENGIDYDSEPLNANTLLNVQEAKVSLYYSYNYVRKVWRLSVRSKEVLVKDVCQKYNGGGHDLACGIKLKNPKNIDEIKILLDAKAKSQS